MNRAWSSTAALVIAGAATVIAARGAVAPSALTSAALGTDTADHQYVGSQRCEPCHQTQYATWRRSLHVQMTKPIAQASVAGDFGIENSITQHRRTYAMHMDGRSYSIAVAHGDRAAETFDVGYTLGAKRFQGYMSPLPDGRIYVLPVFWNVAWQRWLDWKEIAPVPDSNSDLRQIWNVNCFNCHATNLRRNFDVTTRTFATTWTEMGIGCESCHGPGRAHVDLAETWNASPSSRPSLDRRVTNRDLSSQLRIFAARTADRRQVYDVCSYCHGNKTNYFTGFVPGDRLEDFATLSLISDPIPATDPQGEFWPDGRPSRFNRPQALTLSGCFRSGTLACTNCHAAHGSMNEHSLKVPMDQSNELCTQCHETLSHDADRARHSHHVASSTGSRCVDCHMSDVNWRMLTRRRDHTFAPPVPELTAQFGIPNACTTCHEDRAPEWASAIMNEWYRNGDERQRAVRAAAAIYGAGSGDQHVFADVANLAVDPRHGSFLRASATAFLGQLSAPGAASKDVIDALVRAAGDPEAVVRVAAVRSLGNLAATSSASALVARLDDPARAVRVTAAEALLDIGIVRLDGSLGARLAQVQEEYADSLATFPDAASRQATLGWLRMSQGRVEDAAETLRIARSLDPDDPRPLVYLGVLSARAGRYSEAITQWQAARALNPKYPNIDRMIEEARKRQTPD